MSGAAEPRHDGMRVAGCTLGADDRPPERRIAVHNPFTRGLVGSVPKATVAEVEQALRVAQAYKIGRAHV